MKDIVFDSPLTEAIIKKRQSRFTMLVEIGKDIANCHSPTTGRIGNIELEGRPCLLSKSTKPERKTAYTVEAISLDRIEDKNKTWIGINQNAANRYVEHYLKNGSLADMTGSANEIKREVFLGKSKLDFLADNTYIELKTPLQQLQIDIPNYVKTKKVAPLSSTDRFVRHIKELANSLKANHRAILLTCFIYDNPGFTVIEKSTNYKEVNSTVEKITKKGVEIWQVNFKITPYGVKLKKYFKLWK